MHENPFGGFRSEPEASLCSLNIAESPKKKSLTRIPSVGRSAFGRQRGNRSRERSHLSCLSRREALEKDTTSLGWKRTTAGLSLGCSAVFGAAAVSQTKGGGENLTEILVEKLDFSFFFIFALLLPQVEDGKVQVRDEIVPEWTTRCSAVGIKKIKGAVGAFSYLLLFVCPSWN